MSERKWTKGPWSVVDGSESGHCCFDYSITSPLKGGCNVVAEVFCGDKPDADLIAAAPDLYDALEALLSELVLTVHSSSLNPEIRDCFTALAKARGEQ